MREVRINLSEVVDRIQEEVRKLVKGFSDSEVAAFAMGQWVPAVDVLEGRADVRILVDLPGVAPSGVEISLAGDQVKIRGEKPSGPAEGATAHLSERRTGSFSRCVSLPACADRERLSAAMKDGLLEIVCPKRAESVEREVKIKIG